MDGSEGVAMDRRQLRRAVVALHTGVADEMLQDLCGVTLPEILWLRASLADRGRRKPQLATLMACRGGESTEPQPEPALAGRHAKLDRPRHRSCHRILHRLQHGPSTPAGGSGDIAAQDNL